MLGVFCAFPARSAVNWAAGALNDAFHAGSANPAGYGPMMLLFGALSLLALGSTLALWRREYTTAGHGLERPSGLAAVPATAPV